MGISLAFIQCPFSGPGSYAGHHITFSSWLVRILQTITLPLPFLVFDDIDSFEE